MAVHNPIPALARYGTDLIRLILLQIKSRIINALKTIQSWVDINYLGLCTFIIFDNKRRRVNDN